MRTTRSSRSWTVVAALAGMQLLNWSCQRSADRAGPAAAPSAPVAAPATGSGTAAAPGTAAGGRGATPAPQGRVVVQLTEEGFVPSQIPAEVGKPITLAITRKTDKTCAKEILFKGEPGKTDLPLDKEVEVTYTPKASGKIAFGCAMGMMIGGSLQVR